MTPVTVHMVFNQLLVKHYTQITCQKKLKPPAISPSSIIIHHPSTSFRMRSKGSCFTLGVWGLRVCSLDVAFTSATVRNRSQPSATVRNRPHEDHSSAEGVTFGGFKRRSCCFVSRGRRGTSQKLWLG